MACSFPTSSTTGFPGTPEEYMTSYPLSSATGGPMGPSAGPEKKTSRSSNMSSQNVCCVGGVGGNASGACNNPGRDCDLGYGMGTCLPLSQCTGNVCCSNGITVGACNDPGRICKGRMGPHPALGDCVPFGSCGDTAGAPGTNLIFHNCYTNSLSLMSGTATFGGTIKPNGSMAIKAGTYVAGQPFLLASGNKPVSGTYHAPTPSSAKSLNVYFESNGSVSMTGCGGGSRKISLSWLLYGAAALVILALLYFFWRRR